ncbi:amino acid adenylation domain-containing protein [Pedobacter antarcticus]|uniref:non-ribosomal peptide synthetase n=1 Tax=Pedobacter antarcticus TaxID=34086 RepID=UPI00292DCA47|nr:amino acid adenylation domain-containing protein [Pedobacter antarcticus]
MPHPNQNIIYKPVDFNPFEEEKGIEKIIPVNEPQKEIWLSCMIGGDDANSAYNESVSLDFSGEMNMYYFETALHKVIERHEALRATISPDGELLIIQQPGDFHLSITDWSSVPEEQDQLIAEFTTQEMNFVFSLVKGPLYRFHLHKLGEKRFLFTVVLHHIIADGWSTGVILDDLSKFYNQLLKNGHAELPDPPQISTYASTIESFKKTAAFEQTNSFWLNQYRESVPVLDLPTDFPRPSQRTYNSKRSDFQLNAELVDQIRKTGAKNGSSMVSTLLHAFEVFLFQQTNQQDIVVGLPAAGQAATENTGLVGHCVNLLPLRSFIDSELTFNAYLKKRKPELLDAYDHQLFTYGQLIKKLNIKRDHSRIPMVPVIFNIDLGMDQGVVFNQLDYKLISNPRSNETFEIFLNISGAGGVYTLEWSYNTQLFKPETIHRMALDFQNLLEKVTTNPDIPIKDLTEEKSNSWKQTIRLWNNTDVDYPKESSLISLIDQTALIYPDKTAVSFGEKSISYFELKLKSDQLAEYLIEQGMTSGDIAGLAAERSIEMLICMLSIMKCGAAYLPLDPEYPAERIEYMLENSRAHFLLVSDLCKGKYHCHATELSITEIFSSLEYVEQDCDFPIVSSNELAYVLYTSGSTGKPKGVQIMHYNLVNFLLSMQKEPGLTSRDKLLAITTISFDIAGLELFLPLISGAELILCDRDTSRDGRRLLELLNNKDVTFMQATPATWRMLIDAGWNSSPGLKVLCGGEAFPPALAEVLHTKVGSVYNMYGPTETTIWSSLKLLSAEDKQITIGKPIQNTRFYILNAQLNPVKPGATGEIYIGGDGVGRGYLNQPELTAERFIKDPFSDAPDSRMYQTGDLGKYTADGEILYMGRSDQQIKVRGFRIEPGEIESVLHDINEVKSAIVIAREDTPGDQRMVAYVIPTENELVESDAFGQWKKELRNHLPEYMIPQDFVILEEFPLTPNHKIDRKALPKPQRIQAIPATQQLSREMTKSETIIATIWSEVLGLTDPSPDDDFFELGGHSLLAVKVMTEIERITGRRLPLATLFESSTIAGLAKKVKDDTAEKWNVLVPIKTSGSKDPLYLVHGGGLNVLLFKSFIQHLDEEQPVYGIQGLGLNTSSTLKYSVEEIAKVYIEEIIASNPDGPYNLAGYSMGGLLAFEMARQLTALGKTINFLGILDTYAGEQQPKSKGLPYFIKKIKRQHHKLFFFVKSFFENPIGAIKYQMKVTEIRIKNTFNLESDEELKHFSPDQRKAYESYEIALSNHTITPADLKVSLFRVNKRLYYLDDLKFLGWNELAQKGVDIYAVPGDHKTFLYPPNDNEFARIIQSVLDKNS